jgi:transposase
MSALSITQKKEWAELLYTRQGLTGKEIAAKVGTTEATVSKWKALGKWDNLKASLSVTKGEQLQNVYEQINELNASIKLKDQGKRFASASEADTLSKLSATAKSLETETSISEIVDTFVGFNDWLRAVDAEQAKQFIVLQDAYIKTKLK